MWFINRDGCCVLCDPGKQTLFDRSKTCAMSHSIVWKVGACHWSCISVESRSGEVYHFQNWQQVNKWPMCLRSSFSGDPSSWLTFHNLKGWWSKFTCGVASTIEAYASGFETGECQWCSPEIAERHDLMNLPLQEVPYVWLFCLIGFTRRWDVYHKMFDVSRSQSKLFPPPSSLPFLKADIKLKDQRIKPLKKNLFIYCFSIDLPMTTSSPFCELDPFP